MAVLEKKCKGLQDLMSKRTDLVTLLFKQVLLQKLSFNS